MDLEKFNLLKTKAENDTNIDDSNAAEKSTKLISLYQRYLSLYLQEVRLLKGISLDKDKLYKKLYQHYKFPSADDKDSFNITLSTTKEVDIYINADDSYCKLCIEYQNQEIVVQYLEATLKNIGNAGYAIKNLVEFKKLSMLEK